MKTGNSRLSIYDNRILHTTAEFLLKFKKAMTYIFYELDQFIEWYRGRMDRPLGSWSTDQLTPVMEV